MDAGIGEAHLPRLFDKGFTVNKSKGTGYGLFLVKQIVEKGNGQIEVSSSQGGGTSILITFPMEVEDGVNGVQRRNQSAVNRR